MAAERFEAQGGNICGKMSPSEPQILVTCTGCALSSVFNERKISYVAFKSPRSIARGTYHLFNLRYNLKYPVNLMSMYRPTRHRRDFTLSVEKDQEPRSQT